MNDDHLLLELRRWLQEERVALPDAEEAGQQIASRLPTTRQRRWWWWRLPSLARTLRPPSTRDTTEYQRSPIPATNGHTPTVIGRTQSMLSPAKALVAAALVFGIGGAIFNAQPFNEQGSVPSAQTDATAVIADPGGVTGSYGLTKDVTPGEVSYEGDVRMRHEDVSRGIPVEASDPRLSGEMTFTMSDRLYSPPAGVFWGEQTIENESGSWTGNVLGAGDPADHARAMGRYTGSGAYEGLWAIIFFDTFDRTFEGVILPGDPPPME